MTSAATPAHEFSPGPHPAALALTAHAARAVARRRVIAAAALLLATVISVSGCAAAKPVAPVIPTTVPSPTSPVVDRAVLEGDAHNTLTTSDDDTVTLVEYADYQCPPCAQISGFVERIASEYDGRITIVVRNFPLEMHDKAVTAARVAEAASRQGKFAEMYAALFSGQQSWKDLAEAEALPIFAGYAADLGLDMTRYAADLASPEVAAVVEKDLADGTLSGVEGTPTIFLNGQRINLWTYEQMKSTIDRVLSE